MTRFMHIADIHLGKRHWNLAQREQDFFDAFKATAHEIIKREGNVLLIAGDLFNSRQLRPGVLLKARGVLQELTLAHVTVVAVEGNHDRALYDRGATWVTLLEDEGLLQVLGQGGEPDVGEADDYRIVGFPWMAHQERACLEGVRTLTFSQRKPTILLCHIGVAEILPNLPSTVSAQEFESLRENVDYVATGHFHRAWTNGFVYCPGPLSPVAIDEYTGGFYQFDVENGEIGPVELVPMESYHEGRKFFRGVTVSSLEELSDHQEWDDAVVQMCFVGDLVPREDIIKALGEIEPLRILLNYRLEQEKGGEEKEKVSELDVFKGLLGEEAALAIRLKELVLQQESAQAIGDVVLSYVKGE